MTLRENSNYGGTTFTMYGVKLTSTLTLQKAEIKLLFDSYL